MYIFKVLGRPNLFPSITDTAAQSEVYSGAQPAHKGYCHSQQIWMSPCMQEDPEIEPGRWKTSFHVLSTKTLNKRLYSFPGRSKEVNRAWKYYFLTFPSGRTGWKFPLWKHEEHVFVCVCIYAYVCVCVILILVTHLKFTLSLYVSLAFI